MPSQMDNPRNAPLYRSRMLRSMFGAMLGLDSVENMLIGPGDLRVGISTGSTAGQTATEPMHGISVQQTSAATTRYIDPPSPGVHKKLVVSATGGTSAGFVLQAGNFLSTLGSSFTRITLVNQGDSVDLVGLSTSVMAVLGTFSTAGGAFMSTTT